MRKIEQHRQKHFDNDNNMEAFARRTFGLDAATLDAHMVVMSQIADGQLSNQGRQWLHAKAKESGFDSATAEKMIRHVLAQPTSQARATAYINGAGQGRVNPALVQEAMDLHRQYQTSEASVTTENRLQKRDEHLRNAGLTYEFEDEPRFEESRQQANGVRKSLEAAMVSSGLVAPKPRSIHEAQHRAQSYANQVADRLEKRMHEDKTPTLRDSIEDSYLTADAFAKKVDVGLAGEGQTPTQVMENTDRARSFGESFSDTAMDDF